MHIENEAIHVCRVMSYKAYSNNEVLNIFSSQHQKKDCFGADIYMIEKISEVIHTDKYSEVEL
jgi:hypothetical protein